MYTHIHVYIYIYREIYTFVYPGRAPAPEVPSGPTRLIRSNTSHIYIYIYMHVCVYVWIDIYYINKTDIMYSQK